MQGFEYDESYLNPAYSASFLNSATPATHTGIWADYTMGDRWTWTVGMFNDLDRRLDKLPLSNVATMLVYEYGDWLVTSSAYIGRPSSESRKQLFDIIAEYQLSEKQKLISEIYKFRNVSSLGGGDTQSYTGFNLFYTFTLNQSWDISLRGEIFDDKDGLSLGMESNTIKGITIAPKYKWRFVTIMPELRYDASNVGFFETDTSPQKSILMSSCGLTCSF
jgi:predicted porin